MTVDGLSGSGKGTLIAATAERFRNLGFSVNVLEDRRIDPLRDCGAKIMPWCNEHRVNKNEFLLPLFVAGNILSQKTVEASLGQYDITLRDRSFISSLAYSAASFQISQKAVWDLCVKHAGVRVPDLVIIVDCDVKQAMERVSLRKGHKDMGLGGKMSGDAAQQQRIKEEYLKIRDHFGSETEVLVLENSGDFCDGRETISLRMINLTYHILSAYWRGLNV